jgi:hypothetical protein
MKKYIVTTLALVLTTSMAYAGSSKPAAPKAKTHVVATEVVKADIAGKTLTVKGPNNSQMTMPCEGRAVSELNAVKVGEKVDVICRDNDKGEHQAIVGIKAAKPVTVKK